MAPKNLPIAVVPPGTNPLLAQHAMDYIYDTVGWALFCTGLPMSEVGMELSDGDVGDRGEEGGVGHGPDPEASAATIDLALSKGDSFAARPGPKRAKKKVQKAGLRPLKVKKDPRDIPLLRRPLQDIYRSKDDYIHWLREQYDKEMHFYKALLSGKVTYQQAYPELFEAGLFDSQLEGEVSSGAKAQLEELSRAFREEVGIISAISDKEWAKVASSKNPKIALAGVLGASNAQVKENLTTYIMVRLQAQRMAKRADLSSQGPLAWYTQDELPTQVDRLADALLQMAFGEPEQPKLENKKR